MNYPINKKAFDDPRNVTLQDFIDLGQNNVIVNNALRLHQAKLISIEQALVLSVIALDQSNKDLFDMCNDLVAARLPAPIIISEKDYETP